MTERPTVAIQYVNYKTKDYLRDSIASVLVDVKSSNIDYSIHILDNDSGDDLAEFTNSHTTINQSDTNVGFGAGHNALAELYDSEYTLLLNPDTRIIQERTIERMVESLNTAIGAAAIGPCLLGEDMNPQAWDHGELDLSSGPLSQKSFYEPRTDKAEVAWVSGAASLVRTADFKAIGGFDTNFFLYKEEEDLSVRLRESGHTVYYDPSIQIQHIGSVIANKESGYFEESIHYYDQKHNLS